MTLKEKIGAEMKVAMKAKDKMKLEALRSIKSAILLAETEAGGGKDQDLSADQELKLLQRLQKQRKDSLGIYEQQGRNDLAEEEKGQLAVIESFLPKQLSEEEIASAVKEIIAKVGASSPKDMGKVMGQASKALAGKADGKIISKYAKEFLS